MDKRASSRYWTRRITRRSALGSAAVGAIGVVGAGLAGCGDDDDDDEAPSATASQTAVNGQETPTAAAGEPVSGGTLKSHTSISFGYQHIDPHAAVWTAGFTWPTHSMLVRYNRESSDPSQWELRSDLAESWEQADATTYIFTLSEGVKFHNLPPAGGRDLTVDDVKFSLERIATAQPQFFRQHEFRDATVETPDDRTITISFPSPQAPFWNRITTAGTVVLPVEVGPNLITSTDPVAGTGAFMHDVVEADGPFRVVRNPDYFKPGLPYLDAYDNNFYPNAEARVVALKSGQIDVAAPGTIQQLRDLQSQSDLTVDSRVALQSQWMIFNAQRPPFDNPLVRRAVSLAIPRQEIVDIAHGGEEDGVMLGPGGLTPDVHGGATWSYDELRSLPGYRTGSDRETDLADARALLESAGVDEIGGELKYTSQTAGWPYADTLATLLQEALREIGIDKSLVPFQYGETLGNLPAGDYDIYYSPQYANGVDPNEYLEFYFHSNGTRNYTDWVNEEYDALFDQQNVAESVEERNGIIRQMLDLLEEDAARVGVTNWKAKDAHYNYVHGYYVPITFGEPDLTYVWTERS